MVYGHRFDECLQVSFKIATVMNKLCIQEEEEEEVDFLFSPAVGLVRRARQLISSQCMQPLRGFNFRLSRSNMIPRCVLRKLSYRDNLILLQP